MGAENPYYKLVLLCFLLAGNLFCAAQKDSLQLSQKNNFEKRVYTSSIVSTEDYIVTVNQDAKPEEIDVKIIDPVSLELMQEFTWSKPQSTYVNHEIHIIEYISGQLIVLSSSVSKKEGLKQLWITTLDLKGNELQHKLLKKFEAYNKRVNQRFELFKNSANTHIGVSVVVEQSKEFLMDLFILDVNLQVIKEKEIILGNIKKVNYPHSFTLTNDGKVFFINGLTEEKKVVETSLGLENRLYQLFRYDPQADKIKQYDVTIADKFISDVIMKLGEDGNLYVTGFYNNTPQKGAEGIFLMVINQEDGSMLRSGKRALNPTLLSDFLTEKQLRKSSSLDDLYLDHFFIDKKGNMTLIAEKFYIEQRLITSPNGVNITTSYYYNWGDILVIELDQNLNYFSHKRIIKKQRSINEPNPYWGYSLMQQNNGEKTIMYNYVSNKKSKNALTVNISSRTSTYFYNVNSGIVAEHPEFDKLKIAPLFCTTFYSSYGTVQDNNHYRFFKLLQPPAE